MYSGMALITTAIPIASGVYYYKLETAANGSMMKKMVLRENKKTTAP